MEAEVSAGAPDLDVNALRLLQAVRDAGSLTGAAGLLGVRQPAVSQHLKRLEQRLGTPLVLRSGRVLSLTEAGEVLARHGESVSAALRAAEAEIASLTGLNAGTVRLVAFPSASAVLVPRALALLHERHPGISVTFEEVEPPASTARVRSGAADVALTFSYADGAEDDLGGLAITTVREETMLLAVPEEHPLASAERVRLGDAAGERWIAGCPRCRGHLLTSAAEAGFTPRVEFATDDYSAVLGLVGAGLGVALLPELVRPAARGHDGVVLRDVAGVARRSIEVATNLELLGAPAVVALIEAIEDAAAL